VERDQSLIERLALQDSDTPSTVKYDSEESVPFGARVLLEVPVKRWPLAGVAQ